MRSIPVLLSLALVGCGSEPADLGDIDSRLSALESAYEAHLDQDAATIDALRNRVAELETEVRADHQAVTDTQAQTASLAVDVDTIAAAGDADALRLDALES